MEGPQGPIGMEATHLKAATAALAASALLAAAPASADSAGSYPYIPTQGYDASQAVVGTADFNGDGHLDLVLQGSRALSIAKGDGEGGFATPALRGPDVVDTVAIADFDGDGSPDLATAARNGGTIDVTVSRGLGNGTFGAVGAASLPGAASGSHVHGYLAKISTADFDGDGDPDIALGGTDSVAELRWADGALLPPVETQVAAATPPSGEPEGDGNLTLYERGPAATGDFNGDGIDDLVLEAQESNFSGNSIVTLTGNPDGTFGQVMTSPGSGYSNAFTAADLDGDGHLDVLGSGSDTNVSSASLVAMYGLGDGSFEPRATLTSPTGFLKPTVGDIDRDGDPDISSLDVRGIPAILENQGSRQFGRPAPGDEGAPQPLGVVGGDFNEDGWPDLAISRDGRLEIELNGLSGEIKEDRERLHIQVGRLAVPKSFHQLGTHTEVNGTCSSTCSVKLTLRVKLKVQRRARLKSGILASARTRWAPHEDNSTDLDLRRSAVIALRHYEGKSFRILVVARGAATTSGGGSVQRGRDSASQELSSSGR
jgi:hypothetical protein